MSHLRRAGRVPRRRSARNEPRGASSDPVCGVAKHGTDGPGRRSGSVSRCMVDRATANSLAADRRGPRQDDQAVKSKLLTGSRWRILDRGLGPTRVCCSRNRPLEPLCTLARLAQGWAGLPGTHAERDSLPREHPLRSWTRRAGSRAGRIGVFASHPIAVSLDDDRLPVMHQPVDQGRGQGVVHVKEGAPFPERSIRG
jgi:hypothetical protein